uniref:Uncharacterized protein n=1 Tax=Caenorhabditis japonica TaxID=281687 RepID=A0A8R1HHK5_CAEJA
MGVFLTIFLYAVTSSVFFPVFQSLVFYKACISLSDRHNITDISHCSRKEAAAKNADVHSLANLILLTSSTGLCITAFFTSRWIGHLSDVKSRKLAFLIPFAGLFITDLTVLVQVLWPTSSPYYFILSEVIYGLFGGYMSITSCAFAIISSRYPDSNDRAKAISKLEGTISFGSMVGFLISSQLDRVEYLGMAFFFLAAHLIAFGSALLMKDIPKTSMVDTEKKKMVSICTGTQIFKNKPAATKCNLKILYFSFACSYFAFIGSTRILFFYLKHKFYWGTEKYGYLKAINQGMTTVMAMFMFPFLKTMGVSDVHLAMFGLATRSIGRGWYAIAWNDYTVFLVVLCEMFSKFPATALRSLISSNVGENERGSAFSLVAVIEAACNLTSSWVFHSAFPLSLSFFPELSFVIMPVCILPALILMFTHRKSLYQSEHPALLPVSVQDEEVEEKKSLQAEPSLHQVSTETDTLTDSSNAEEKEDL